MAFVAYSLTLLLSYLLGSIPTGYLVAKAKGIDIRTVGSGNIGATNVFRHLGKPAGIFVLAADAAKGCLAVALLAPLVAARLYPDASPLNREWLAICAGVTAVLGHNYTCWLNFKGGKGVATTAGVLGALVPWTLVITLSLWILVVAFSRYVSLASICAAIAMPIATWLTAPSEAPWQRTTLTIITAALGALGIYKHKANIHRLLAGTESRLGPKKPVAQTSQGPSQ